MKRQDNGHVSAACENQYTADPYVFYEIQIDVLTEAYGNPCKDRLNGPKSRLSNQVITFLLVIISKGVETM